MPEILRTCVESGDMKMERLYMAACKGDPASRQVIFSEACDWDDADPLVATVVEKHVMQFAVATEDQTVFHARYTGDPVDVSQIAPGSYNGRLQTPTVEVLEAMVNAEASDGTLKELGDLLAFKHLARATAKPSLLAVVVFTAAGRRYAMVTVCDLEPEKTETFWDEGRNKFITAIMNNIVGRTAIAKAALYPCLDAEGQEAGDLFVYTRSAGKAWWETVECIRQHSPAKEAKTLMTLISKQLTDSVPPSFFEGLQSDLAEAKEGIYADEVADALERQAMVSVDREQFREQWAAAYGEPGYRPAYDKIYESPAVRTTIEAGDVQVKSFPADLASIRQVLMGTESFLVIRVPGAAKLALGKDLNISLQSMTPEELQVWMKAVEE